MSVEDQALRELLAQLALQMPVGAEERALADGFEHAVVAELTALEDTAHALGVAVEPVEPPLTLRERVLASASTPEERLAPFTARLAELFDVSRERARELLGLFAVDGIWTALFPGFKYYDLQGGPALGASTAGLVQLVAGGFFPPHRHIGEERVFVLQGAFVDGDRRVGPGDLAVMPDGSSHEFRVVSDVDLYYAVVVQQIEFPDGTRAP